jgi:hypothetical protein
MSGADDTAAIRQIFTDQTQTAKDLVADAKSDIQKAWSALQNSSTYNYDPYNWEIPPQPFIGGVSTPTGPTTPTRPNDPIAPTLVPYNINVPNPNFGNAPTDVPSAPTITLPALPSGEPTDVPGNVPSVGTPNFPSAPTFLALPNSGLPYPSVSLPTAPTLLPPSFTAVEPGDIQSITLADYLAKLTDIVHRLQPAHPRARAEQLADVVPRDGGREPERARDRQHHHDLPDLWAVPASRSRSKKRSSRAPLTVSTASTSAPTPKCGKR